MLFPRGSSPRSGKGDDLPCTTNPAGLSACRANLDPDGRLKLASLIGRLLQATSDVRSLWSQRDRGGSERLLSISGEDPLDVDRANPRRGSVSCRPGLMPPSNETPSPIESSGVRVPCSHAVDGQVVRGQGGPRPLWSVGRGVPSDHPVGSTCPWLKITSTTSKSAGEAQEELERAAEPRGPVRHRNPPHRRSSASRRGAVF